VAKHSAFRKIPLAVCSTPHQTSCNLSSLMASPTHRDETADHPRGPARGKFVSCAFTNPQNGGLAPAVYVVASPFTIHAGGRIRHPQITDVQTVLQLLPLLWFYPGPDRVTGHITRDRAGLFREVHLIAPWLDRRGMIRMDIRAPSGASSPPAGDCRTGESATGAGGFVSP
jgi:hypothetical protein